MGYQVMYHENNSVNVQYFHFKIRRLNAKQSIIYKCPKRQFPFKVSIRNLLKQNMNVLT